MVSLRNFAVRVEPLAPDATGDAAFARFEAAPDCPLLPVVGSDGIPIGLIERNAFLMRFAGAYGRAIYGNRPVTKTMATAPLQAEADTPAGDFAETTLRAQAERLLQGFIIVEHGRYFGVGAVLNLLQAVANERIDTMGQLRQLTQDLSVSNRDLSRQRRMAEAVIEHIPSMVAVRKASDGRFVLINQAGANILGVNPQAVIGRTADEIEPGDLADQLRASESALDSAAPNVAHDIVFRRADNGHQRILRTARIPVDVPGDDSLVLTIAEDVTEMRSAVAKIAELAHFDTLTGLANRTLFGDRVSTMMDLCTHQAGQQVALLALDLDRFKLVNDTLGHGAGDALLRQVADRLRVVLRDSDVAARLGGDEFAVALMAPQVESVARRVADRVIASLKQPFQIGKNQVHIGGSIGVAIYPDDATNLDDLLKHADIALYQVKRADKGMWRRFCPAMRLGQDERNALERDLRLALEADQIEMHVQPFLDFATGAVAGFECLMRWCHPRHGYIPPATFIPIAEEIGLIDELGGWIIRRACDVAAGLPEHLTMAVNISAVQFRLPGLVHVVAQALSHSGIAPQRLELEITESMLIADEAQVLQSIRQLRDLGLHIALDDFGTGFASFAYLQRFPFSKIKIDRSFIEGLPDRQSSRAIVSAVAVLGRQLGMSVIAEGVEKEVQLQTLRELGCSGVQGYLIGYPSLNPFDHLDASHLPARSQSVA